MPLETGTYISDLVSTNPAHTDGLDDADSHLRLIKSTIKATFPNITGPVTSTQAEIDDDIAADPLPTNTGAFIKMWSGTVASIPANYHLCDGSTLTIGGNSVTLPDLRSKFIIGVDSDTGTYPVGGTGGATSAVTDSQGGHDHGGTSGAHALTVAELPAHTHPNVLTDPGHIHAVNTFISAGGISSANFAAGNGSNQVQTFSATTGITISNASQGGGGTHQHTISSDGAHTHAVATVPPYYALCFVARVS